MTALRPSSYRCSAALHRDCTAAERHLRLTTPRTRVWRPSAPMPVMRLLPAQPPLWPLQMMLPRPAIDSRCQTMATPHVGQ